MTKHHGWNVIQPNHVPEVYLSNVPDGRGGFLTKNQVLHREHVHALEAEQVQKYRDSHWTSFQWEDHKCDTFCKKQCKPPARLMTVIGKRQEKEKQEAEAARRAENAANAFVSRNPIENSEYQEFLEWKKQQAADAKRKKELERMEAESHERKYGINNPYGVCYGNTDFNPYGCDFNDE